MIQRESKNIREKERKKSLEKYKILKTPFQPKSQTSLLLSQTEHKVASSGLNAKYIYIYVYIHVYACVFYIYTHMYTHIHIHIHIRYIYIYITIYS